MFNAPSFLSWRVFYVRPIKGPSHPILFISSRGFVLTNSKFSCVIGPTSLSLSSIIFRFLCMLLFCNCFSQILYLLYWLLFWPLFVAFILVFFSVDEGGVGLSCCPLCLCMFTFIKPLVASINLFLSAAGIGCDPFLSLCQWLSVINLWFVVAIFTFNPSLLRGSSTLLITVCARKSVLLRRVCF